MQEGDVRLFQTTDDGDVSVVNGVTEMSGGLETATYLSLFGGNEQDDGLGDKGWWGNLGEQDPAFQYKSETQFLLKSIPATSANLLKINAAAIRDLNWLLDKNIASSVDVSSSIPALNWVKIVVEIQAIGNESQFEFTENWKATQ